MKLQVRENARFYDDFFKKNELKISHVPGGGVAGDVPVRPVDHRAVVVALAVGRGVGLGYAHAQKKKPTLFFNTV